MENTTDIHKAARLLRKTYHIDAAPAGSLQRMERQSDTKTARGAGAGPVLFTVREVADILRVGRGTAYAWIRDGHLPAVRWGQRGTRVRQQDLDRFLDENPLAAERAA